MSRKAVLLIGELTHIEKEWKAWSSKYVLKEFINGSRKDFLRKLQDGEYDDVVGLYRSNKSVAVTGPFDSALVSLLPESLKYICHNGAGYDNIDINPCTQRGIAISSTPIAVDDATADVAIFLMLGALRQITIPMTAIRDGLWEGEDTNRSRPERKDPGYIRNGWNRQSNGKASSSLWYEDCVPQPFAATLAQSAVLSLNLSLNAKTHHIISARELEKMRDGVVIVNTARGALMDEKDLVAAVESGKVASAGLDVFENEPAVENGLLRNPKVVLLPHIGTNTYETQMDMELLVLKNLEFGVDKGKLLTPIPEQKGMLGDRNGHL